MNVTVEVAYPESFSVMGRMTVETTQMKYTVVSADREYSMRRQIMLLVDISRGRRSIAYPVMRTIMLLFYINRCI